MIEKNKLKRWAQWAAWLAVVALLAIFYANKGNEQSAEQQGEEQSLVMFPDDNTSVAGDINAATNYESVMLPSGMSDMILRPNESTSCGFGCLFAITASGIINANNTIIVFLIFLLFYICFYVVIN